MTSPRPPGSESDGLLKQQKMAADHPASLKGQKNTNGVAAVLTYAACEWFLIFLLLVDGLISYILVQFARYCELQTPCFLCSRLDHVFHKGKPNFYWNLLCENHRSEISSMLSCQIHGNLADGRGMCGDCLLSFTKKNKPNPDMHRLLLGKVGFDLNYAPPGHPNAKLCSCCNKPWRSRQNAQKFLQLKLPRKAVSKPNIPMPRRTGRRESLKKMRDKLVFSSDYGEGVSGDSRPRAGYRVVKITSDSESEIQFSEDDRVLPKRTGRRRRCNVQSAPEAETTSEKLSKNVVTTKVIPSSSHAKQQPIHPSAQLALNNNRGTKCLTEGEKTPQASMPELILLDGIPPPSNPAKVQPGVSLISQNANTTTASELISLVDACPSLNIPEALVRELSKTSNDNRASNSGFAPSNKHEEILKLYNSTAAAGMSDHQVINGPFPGDHSELNQRYVPDSAADVKQGEAHNPVAEQTPSEKCHGLDQNLEHVQSPNISSEKAGSLLYNTGHYVKTDCGEESHIDEPSSSSTMSHLHSDLESFDRSTVSDIEGEDIVDRLKRQVEYDRKRLSTLHKELEEERGYAAVAADEAMAMITRLQEEKAALHMEALQYLRMMDEQAEYDVDALEKANDLLAEKEKEIQDLEAELEYYRIKYPDELIEQNMANGCFISKIDANIPSNFNKIPRNTNDSDKPGFVNSSWPGLEDEKLYISEQLRSLERKLSHFAGNGHLSDEGPSEYAKSGGHHFGKDGSQTNDKIEDNYKDQAVSVEKDHSSEISDLKDRLEALKADISFLERSVNALENGKEGLLFVQEIALQLQELRNLGIRRRQSVA